MKTDNFTQLIRAVTGRAFTLHEQVNAWTTEAAGESLKAETRYNVRLTLPVTGRQVSFMWTTPKSDEKMLRSFITAFTSKYREPNPAAYTGGYLADSPSYNWQTMSPEKREHAYGHHAFNMKSKETLLAEVQARFSCPEIATALNKWGFYETEYGIGIFCFWQTQWVTNAMANMRAFLADQGIATKEEFSDARWVYRFRIEANRDIHTNLLKQFCAISP
jgi:hypothetical protein